MKIRVSTAIWLPLFCYLILAIGHWYMYQRRTDYIKLSLESGVFTTSLLTFAVFMMAAFRGKFQVCLNILLGAVLIGIIVFLSQDKITVPQQILLAQAAFHIALVRNLTSNIRIVRQRYRHNAQPWR